jgi:hypothetical protein
MEETLPMKKFTGQKPEQQLLAYDHSRISNCRTKIFEAFPGIFGVFPAF